MGAYHGRPHKTETTEPISVASTSEPAPPVFGSPIDSEPKLSNIYNNIFTETYLASIANKVGVGVNLISEIAAEDIREESHSPHDAGEIIGSSVDKPPEPAEAPPVTEEEGSIEKEPVPKARKQVDLIPIVFHWDLKGGESDIYVCGSFNNWEKIPMNKR